LGEREKVVRCRGWKYRWIVNQGVREDWTESSAVGEGVEVRVVGALCVDMDVRLEGKRGHWLYIRWMDE
jgi:hypothetical protein